MSDEKTPKPVSQRPLTAKQQRYAMERAKGKSMYESYKLAKYSVTPRMDRNMIERNAQHVEKNPRVKTLIQELREKANIRMAEKFIWDREESTRRIIRLAEKAEAILLKQLEEGKLSSFSMKAVLEYFNELNKMHGINEKTINLHGLPKTVILKGDDEIAD